MQKNKELISSILYEETVLTELQRIHMGVYNNMFKSRGTIPPKNEVYFVVNHPELYPISFGIAVKILRKRKIEKICKRLKK